MAGGPEELRWEAGIAFVGTDPLPREEGGCSGLRRCWRKNGQEPRAGGVLGEAGASQ